jgi:hypothetical protein
MDALLNWERFKTEVDQIEAELASEENRQREQFHARKEQYESVLGKLLSQRTVQATFDPKEPEQSYQVFYQGVLRKLQDWLREQREMAGRVENEWEYLIQERGVEATEERSEAGTICQSLDGVMGDLNIETIADWEKFQQYISELQNLQERLRRLHQSLERRRTQKGALEESEKPVLEALALQRRSLEDIRRQLRVSLDDLFGILKSLYRKGYLELEVRRRE